MGEIITALIHIIPALIGAAVTAVVTIITMRRKGKKPAATDILENVITMLPNLINLTELTNSSKTGDEKKAFLMDYIGGLVRIMGGTVDDNMTAFISNHIDNIIALTKQMHMESEDNTINENF